MSEPESPLVEMAQTLDEAMALVLAVLAQRGCANCTGLESLLKIAQTEIDYLESLLAELAEDELYEDYPHEL